MAKTWDKSINRRQFLHVFSAATTIYSLPISLTGAFAENPKETKLHAISAFGDLKYPANFTHFDYVNVDAPKGGRIHFAPPSTVFNQNLQTFNTLNTFVRKGDAPPRMEMCFDTLMVGSLDEADAAYCHTASWVKISSDQNTIEFAIRPEAKFHDGSPLTAHDVEFSTNTLRGKGHPTFALAMQELQNVKALNNNIVRFTFSGKQSARAIFTIAGLPILSKEYYSAHPFDSSNLDKPLSSGQYKVGKLEAGTFIEYERVSDYWAQDLPTNIGIGNFDIIRIDVFSERQAGFEAFKKGDIHFREEFTSKTWATEYSFPAVKKSHVIKRTFPREKNPSMQAWAINQRRKKFQDPRVRRAIGLCFDFEWTNEKLFFGAYKRSNSLFENSLFKTSGLPTNDELKIMEPMREILPDAAFKEPYLQPASDGSGRDRKLLRQAVNLLKESGWERKGKWLHKDGEELTIEVIYRSPVFERILAGFIQNMQLIGIKASMKPVYAAQFKQRMDTFDFDLIGIARSMSPTPSAESLESMFSTLSADIAGTANLSGVKDKTFDILIDHMRNVKSREELTTVMRVVDRLSRARHDWIQNWHSSDHRAAYWDMFGFVTPKPDFGWPVEALWWFDEEKAKRIGKA